MATHIDSLTEAQRDRFDEWADRWVDIGLRTDAADRRKFEQAAEQCYRAAGLAWHRRVIWVASPIVTAIAVPAAALAIRLHRAKRPGAANDGVNAAVDDAISDVMTGAVRAAVRGIVSDEIANAIVEAIASAVDAAVTHTATDIAVDISADSAADTVIGAVLGVMDDVKGDFMNAAVDAAVRETVWQAMNRTVETAWNQAVGAVVSGAVDDAVELAVNMAVRDAVNGVHGVTRQRGPRERMTGAVASLIAHLGDGHTVERMRYGAKGRLEFAACTSFWREVAGLELRDDLWRRSRAYEASIESAAWWSAHRDFVIACERPTVIRRELTNPAVARGRGSHRLHCADGPAIGFADGWGVYAIHGVQIPFGQRYIVERPETITVAGIEAESNAEVRRVMLERYGPERYVRDSGAVVTDELPADHPIVGLRTGRVWVKRLADDGEPIVYVDLLNSTPEPDGSVKRYMLRVEPHAYFGEAMRNVHAAAASTWRRANGRLLYERYQDYAPAHES